AARTAGAARPAEDSGRVHRGHRLASRCHEARGRRAAVYEVRLAATAGDEAHRGESGRRHRYQPRLRVHRLERPEALCGRLRPWASRVYEPGRAALKWVALLCSIGTNRDLNVYM